MADDVKPPPLTARDLVHWAAFVKHLEGKVDVVEALGHGCGVVLDGTQPCAELARQLMAHMRQIVPALRRRREEEEGGEPAANIEACHSQALHA